MVKFRRLPIVVNDRDLLNMSRKRSDKTFRKKKQYQPEELEKMSYLVYIWMNFYST